MTTLTDFLLARVSADEGAARLEQADAMVGARWKGYSREAYEELQSRVLTSSARVLAECEAKRRIVEEFVKHDERNSLEQQAWQVWDLILHTIAAVYASHPDYQAEWAIA